MTKRMYETNAWSTDIKAVTVPADAPAARNAKGLCQFDTWKEARAHLLLCHRAQRRSLGHQLAAAQRRVEKLEGMEETAP